ncbi:MAG: peptidoglycan -binding protein [Hyphomicrobiales bacterium]
MALSARRQRPETSFYWPGFVDAMASLLLVIIFVLSIFMLVQFILARDISEQDSALNRLRSQIAELSELLALEKAETAELQTTISSLTEDLGTSRAEASRLGGLLETERSTSESAGGALATLKSDLDSEKKIRSEALAKVELLNQQIAALRRQLAQLTAALETAESRDKESQTKIADLGRRLNAALARRVQQLARYRSEFFGKLREILSQRSDIQIVGDRFVFQAEVFFATGQASINAQGQRELDKLASALVELQGIIPEEINWVLRVDGHTDDVPISTAPFPSNWELSTARAISVVRHLIRNGVPPTRLVAAGFGEFQPLDPANSIDARRKNRRIELKLTER